MNLRKIGTTALTIALVAGSSITNMAYALEKRAEITNMNYQVVTPFWISISSISPKISAEDTTLYPEVYVKAKSSSSLISGTMYLEKYVSGKWTNVTSWSIKGTGSAAAFKSYSGTSGIQYRTRVVVTVGSEKVEATSSSCQI